MDINNQYKNSSLLAGNSRVYVNQHNEIIVEAQLKAFDAALLFAKRIRNEQGKLPRISIAFDHRGIFRRQFLLADLSHSQKRNPRLCHLHSTIIDVFIAVVDKHQIPLNDIRVIHEDSARQHLTHRLMFDEIPEYIKRRMMTRGSAWHHSSAFDSLYPEPKQKLTCAAITTEYFERAAGQHKNADTLLDVFFEDCEWSSASGYVKGLQLGQMLGMAAAIRLNLVNKKGDVSAGNISQAVIIKKPGA